MAAIFWKSVSWCRRFLRLLSFWKFLGFIVVSLLVTVCVISPLMGLPNRSWRSWDDWNYALKLAYWGIIATLGLRVTDSFARRTYRISQTKRARLRNLSVVHVLGEISKKLKHQKKLGNFSGDRQTIMQAIAYKIADVIGEKEETSIMASLLDFSGVGAKDNSKITVVARSWATRKIPVDYDRAVTVAWNAICHGKAECVNDCRFDKRFDGLGKKYRSIISVPIVREDRALAAISIDHPDPYRFAGYLDEIETATQPYIGILLLTYPPYVVYFPCKYDPSHK